MKNKDIKGKNILITGGAGFIGSFLAEHLATYNQVIVLDNLLYGTLENLKNVSHAFIKADITDTDIKGIMSKYDIDLVYHLASYHLDDSLKNPMRDFMTSGLGGLRVLEACRYKKVERLIFTSTGSVYGQPQSLNHDEKHPLLPTTPYGASKSTMDNYCRIYHDIYNVKTVRLRYYNIYGPKRSVGAIPQFIIKALNGGEIEISGGKQTRTPTYISDTVEATYRAGWIKGIEGRAFNIAATEYITILDLAKLIVRLCNAEDKITFKINNYRPGEIMHLRPNVNYAKEILGWEAKVNLEKGLLNLIEYFKKKY